MSKACYRCAFSLSLCWWSEPCNDKTLFTVEVGAHTHIHVHASMHMHACMCACVHVYTHVQTHICVHTHTYPPAYIQTHAYPLWGMCQPTQSPSMCPQCTPLERQLSLVRWGEWGIQKPHSQPVGTSRGQIKSLVFPAHVLWHGIQSTRTGERENG